MSRPKLMHGLGVTPLTLHLSFTPPGAPPFSDVFYSFPVPFFVPRILVVVNDMKITTLFGKLQINTFRLLMYGRPFLIH